MTHVQYYINSPFRFQLQVIIRLHILKQEITTSGTIISTHLTDEIFEFLDLLAFYRIEEQFLTKFINEAILH
jgi:hypothetical protein